MKTKYDWSNVPKEVKWIATDEDGNCFGHKIKPSRYMNAYSSGSFNSFLLINMIPFEGDWQDSLEERPNEE